MGSPVRSHVRSPWTGKESQNVFQDERVSRNGSGPRDHAPHGRRHRRLVRKSKAGDERKYFDPEARGSEAGTRHRPLVGSGGGAPLSTSRSKEAPLSISAAIARSRPSFFCGEEWGTV